MPGNPYASRDQPLMIGWRCRFHPSADCHLLCFQGQGWQHRTILEPTIDNAVLPNTDQLGRRIREDNSVCAVWDIIRTPPQTVVTELSRHTSVEVLDTVTRAVVQFFAQMCITKMVFTFNSYPIDTATRHYLRDVLMIGFEQDRHTATGCVRVMHICRHLLRRPVCNDMAARLQRQNRLLLRIIRSIFMPPYDRSTPKSKRRPCPSATKACKGEVRFEHARASVLHCMYCSSDVSDTNTLQYLLPLLGIDRMSATLTDADRECIGYVDTLASVGCGG